MSEIEYKDTFTLDGRAPAPRGVTLEKVQRVESLIADARRGSRISTATLSEAITSGDLAASTAHFINLITIPQLDEIERDWRPIAGVREVPDFRPAVLHSTFGSLTGAGIDADGGAARVPEGTPYPMVTVSGVESAYSKIAKRGLRADWTFEAMVNDPIGYLEQIPGEMAQVTLDTEWAEIGEALTAGGTALASQTLADGTVVPANSPIVNADGMPNGILAAIYQMSLVEINGTRRKVGTLSGYTVIVPVGKKVQVDWAIARAQSILQVVPAAATGGNVFAASPLNAILSTVTVIEHEAVTGTQWRIIPAPGSYRRPVIDLLRLRGYATPQIRYRNDGDEFSYDADTASFRYRYVVGGAQWFDEVVIMSTGAGS